MGANKEKKEIFISKNLLQLIFSLICMFSSFFFLNNCLLSQMGITVSKNFTLWIINISFSVSWIFLFMGIILSFQGFYRRVVYGVFFFFFSIVSYLESISYFILGRYSSFDKLHFSISEIFEATSQEFILVFFISLLFFILSCYFQKKVSIKRRSFYEFAYPLLTLILLFILFRSCAYLMMGPKTIYVSGKKSNDNKTVYLENKDAHNNLKISGIYDFTLRTFYDCLKDSFWDTLNYLEE